MPELPEVETTKEGIKPYLASQVITHVTVRNHQLRIPVPLDMDTLCTGKKIIAISRRAKYIVIHLSSGYIVVHLGMSGHLRIVPVNTPPEKHDHLDLLLSNGFILRYCDPRRFGLFTFVNDETLHQHPLFATLGPEPLSTEFAGEYLYRKSRNRTLPIKSFIMNNDIVVGVGNIYATESLFHAHLHPLKPAHSLTKNTSVLLSTEIKRVLNLAIQAGGTTLKDFYAFDGKPGYFKFSLHVYGRKGEACVRCNTSIKAMVIGGRNSAYCPNCQVL